MTTISRLTDSCLVVTTDQHATMFDPGFHTFLSGEIDLASIPDVTRLLITHEHGDHVHPDFVKWLVDRGSDLAVYSNEAVAALLDPHGIDVLTDPPDGVSAEDVLHAKLPNGTQPPNRSFTIDGVLTHPGDSRDPEVTAPILALPLLAPWGSATGAVEHARRVRPAQVIPVHDFYLSPSGREWLWGMVGGVLGGDNIELIKLDWGQSYTL